MPPKKATGTTTKKASAPSEHPPYKDMIKEAILQLKERNGSSRQAIKKYLSSNFKGIKESHFDNQFNQALRRGVAAGDFTQPKGPSGPVKLQKKDTAKPAAKPAKAAGEKVVKKAAPKKAAAVPKKATTTTTKAAAKPKAAAAKPKVASTTAKKPATKKAATEKTALNKTKTGKVSKATTTKAAPKKAAATKKAATKKKEAAPAAATASE